MAKIYDPRKMLEILKSATIINVENRAPEEMETMYKDEYCAYELIIQTDRGTLWYAGCHDSGGVLVLETNDMGSDQE